MTWQSELKKIIKGNIKFNKPIFRHTTWRVGGRADVLVEPCDREDLVRVIKFSRKKKVPFYVIGSGSNLLVSDKGVGGIVIRLSRPFFKNIQFENNNAFVGAGLSLNRLVNLTKNRGLSGCEFLAGIPGTLGGALVMNAGVKDILSSDQQYLSLSDLVKEIKVLNSAGRQKVLKKKAIKFSYRYSNLSRFVVISAKLKLKPKSRKKISSLIKRFISYKKSVQDLKAGSAGCVFKNPADSKNNNLTAGKLIDGCGLKGMRLGNAEISLIHANFIINRGGAKAAEIFKLMQLARKRVKQRFNVSLEPEVKIVGKF